MILWLIVVSRHYQDRLISVAYNRLNGIRKSRFVGKPSKIDPTAIVRLDDSTFQVPSESKPAVMYDVNTAVGMCTCHVGSTGAPCKHQFLVGQTFRLSTLNDLPVDCPDMRLLFHELAVGTSSVPQEFFASLRTESERKVSSSARPLHPESEDDMEVCEPEGDNDHTTEAERRSEKKQSIASGLYDFVTGMMKELTECPEEMEKPLEAFLKTYGDLKNRSQLASALTCFGKTAAASASLSKPRYKLAGLKYISVQPTAVARRKNPLSGRRRLHVGRPMKGVSNAASKAKFSGAVLPRRKAPHNLSVCVENNQQLGKTHQAK